MLSKHHWIFGLQYQRMVDIRKRRHRAIGRLRTKSGEWNSPDWGAAVQAHSEGRQFNCWISRNQRLPSQWREPVAHRIGVGIKITSKLLRRTSEQSFKWNDQQLTLRTARELHFMAQILHGSRRNDELRVREKWTKTTKLQLKQQQQKTNLQTVMFKL